MKKKKTVKLINTFQMGSFPMQVLFSVGYSGEQILKHLKKHKAKLWAKGIEADIEFINSTKYCSLYRELVSTETERPTKKLYYLIFTETFMFTDNSYSILAHEVLHTVQFALRGVLDIDNEYEAFAYTHTFIMDKCLELIRGNEDAKKNK